MKRDELLGLLEACPVLSKKKTVFTTNETATLDLLLKAGNSGPAPISRVKSLDIGDNFVQVASEESVYMFPHDVVFGLKWKDREQRASRTGFHA